MVLRQGKFPESSFCTLQDTKTPPRQHSCDYLQVLCATEADLEVAEALVLTYPLQPPHSRTGKTDRASVHETGHSLYETPPLVSRRCRGCQTLTIHCKKSKSYGRQDQCIPRHQGCLQIASRPRDTDQLPAATACRCNGNDIASMSSYGQRWGPRKRHTTQCDTPIGNSTREPHLRCVRWGYRRERRQKQ